MLSQTVSVALTSDVIEQGLRGSELADSVGYHNEATRERTHAAELAKRVVESAE